MVNTWIHRIAGVLILVITTVFSIIGIKKSEGRQIDGHYVLGLIVFGATFAVALYGVAVRSMTRRLKWKTRLIHIL